MVIYYLTGGGHEIFDLKNFASHVSDVCPPGELVSCVISMSSPNFRTNSLYLNHSSPYKLLYYAWVTCDYISRKISPRNWFQCFPVYACCCSGSVSGFRVFHTPGKTRSNSNFMRQSITTTLHASHGKRRMSKEIQYWILGSVLLEDHSM